jgi:hypothetical protein
MESFSSGPVIGKGFSDFMLDVYEEFHSGGEKNIKQERGEEWIYK